MQFPTNVFRIPAHSYLVLLCLLIAPLAHGTPVYVASPAGKSLSSALPPQPRIVDSADIPQIRKQYRAHPDQQSTTSSELSAIVRHAAQPVAEQLARARFARHGLLPRAAQLEIRAAQLQRIELEHAALDSTLRQLAITPIATRQLSMTSNVTILDGISDTDIERLRSSGVTITRERILQPSLDQSVPLIGANQVWQRSGNDGIPFTGRGMSVAVIDTGIDYTHPDFGSCTTAMFRAGTCARVRGGYDFFNRDDDPIDEQDHGSHVAGIIGANGTMRGVAPDADLYAYQVCGAMGCTEGAMLEAFERIVDPNQDGDPSDHHDVANVSIGGPGDPDDTLSAAVDVASRSGVVMVVAAGNSGPGAETVESPGAARRALTVAASFGRSRQGTYHGLLNPAQDEMAPFSSRGPVRWGIPVSMISKPDITAPGALICSTRRRYRQSSANNSFCLDDDHWAFSGTSMATPHVTGAVALLLQAKPQLTPEQVKLVLKANSDLLLDPRAGNSQYPSAVQGAGRLNILRAVLSEEIPAEDREAFLHNQNTFSGPTLPVFATVRGSGLQWYRVEYRPAASSVPWQLLHEAAEPLRNGLVGSIDLSTLPDSAVELLMTATYNNATLRDRVIVTLEHTKITAPRDRSSGSLKTVEPGEFVDVRGTVNPPLFQRFTVEVCGRASNQSTCHMIHAEGDGMSPVSDGLLARVPVEEGYGGPNAVVVRTYRTNGITSEHVREFLIDTEADARFSHRLGFSNGGDPAIRSIAVADLTNDGRNELIYLDCNAVHAVDDQGAELPGFPIAIPPAADGQFCSVREVQVADIDEDGQNDLAIRVDNVRTDRIYAFRGNGTPFLPPPQAAYRNMYDQFHLGKVAPGDKLQLVQSLINQLEVSQFDGTRLGQWNVRTLTRTPVVYFFGSYSQIVLDDIDGDGLSEVFFAGIERDQATQQPYITISGFSDGRALPGFPQSFATELDNVNLVIADLNSDGQRELLFHTLEVDDAGTYTSVIHALTNRGSEMAGWPVRVDNSTQSTISELLVADVDRNGRNEVIASTRSCQMILSDTGSLWPGFPRCDRESEFSVGGPVLASNLEGDGILELLKLRNNPVGSLMAGRIRSDGSSITSYDIPLDNAFPWEAAFATSDINHDGLTDLVIASGEAVRLYHLSACSNSGGEWNQNGANAGRTFTVTNEPVSTCANNDVDTPHILQQPIAEWMRPGFYMTDITVRAESAAPMAFQWQVLDGGRWRDIEGERGSIYQADARLATRTMLRVLVSNPFGTTVSEPTEYRSWYDVRFDGAPVVTILPGRTERVLQAHASGEGDITYFWKVGGRINGEWSWTELYEGPESEVTVPYNGPFSVYEVTATNGAGVVLTSAALVDRGYEGATPTPTPMPTATPAMTATASPTASLPGNGTPTPTSSPTPSASQTPMATPKLTCNLVSSCTRAVRAGTRCEFRLKASRPLPRNARTFRLQRGNARSSIQSVGTFRLTRRAQVTIARTTRFKAQVPGYCETAVMTVKVRR